MHITNSANIYSHLVGMVHNNNENQYNRNNVIFTLGWSTIRTRCANTATHPTTQYYYCYYHWLYIFEFMLSDI
jgi:hypothetical protein